MECDDNDRMPTRDQLATFIGVLEENVLNETVSTDELGAINKLLKSSSLFILRSTNARRPINRLPPETLRMIFCDLMSGKIKDVGWRHTHSRVCDVLRLSHVLTHFPAFWTSIRDTHPAETKMFLGRSKDQSLKVLAAAERRSDWFWDICMEYGLSIQELHWVSGKGNESEVATIPTLDIKASNVERLSLSRAAKDQARYSRSSVLRGATTKVKFLSLNNMNWLPANRFPALTHLTISGTLSMPDLLSFLPHCPNLQSLILRSCRLVDRHGLHNGGARVQMPQLRRLSLDLELWGPLEDLLSNLGFSRPAAAVEVVIGDLTSRSESVLGMHFPNTLLISGFSHGDYAEQPLTRLCLKQSPSPRRWSSILALNDVGGICSKFLGPLDLQHATMVQHNVALSHITELWLEGADDTLYHLFCALRRHMTSLRTLNIVHSERSHLSLALCLHVLRRTQTLRVVFGRAVYSPDDGEMRSVIRELSRMRAMSGKGSRLILRAPTFLPEYYETAAPSLARNWDSVEVEVDTSEDIGMAIPPLCQADWESPLWEGW
ncbi:hypothetical protein C2E23DRAFT_872374 [Lenzites betulinus]|nr:hypothetical protein C2E23DRAFT_872374 [Lenzites betulinus]